MDGTVDMDVEMSTFFSFAFSLVSSFDAFAACRFSCFAVNYPSSSASTNPPPSPLDVAP